MFSGPLPTNELARLRYLQSVQILDTPPEPEFDDLAALASHICQTPVALVTIMDSQIQWFKAAVGTDIRCTDRETAFCAHAILQPELMVVPDLQQDSRFARNPFVTNPPHVRFYAGMPLVTDEGYPLGTLCVLDLQPRTLTTEQAKAMKTLGRQIVNLLRFRHKSRHDSLTGLPNRAYFIEQVNRRIERARRDPSWLFAAMFVDLDHFKLINDSMGHAAGDLVLSTIASRLSSSLRRGDSVSHGDSEQTVARMGGDEFTVLLDGIQHAEDAARVARRFLRAARQPVIFEGQELICSASVGVVVAGRHQNYQSSADLLRDADAAMYKAKAEGKNRYAIFDYAMHQAAEQRLNLETDVQSALERGEFFLMYQPVVCMETGRVRAVEALLRWNRGGATLAPAEFLSVAEETGVMVPIGRWVIEQALGQLARWRENDPAQPRFGMTINLSRKQLLDAELPSHIARAIEKHGLSPADIELEVTENSLMESSAAIESTFEQLRTGGLRMAIDDFGAGYSSIACLLKFSFQVLKIDRSLLNSVSKEQDSKVVFQAVVTLAHGLGLAVVGEGIETAEQAEVLRSMGCEMGQGYYFAHPLTPAGVSGYLQSGTSLIAA